MRRSETASNKWLFDRLYAERGAIEAAFGQQLDWRRMEDKKASKISYAQAFDGYDRECWPQMIGWMSEHIRKLEAALREPLLRLNRQIRTHDEEDI
jgi:hypothetical protein